MRELAALGDKIELASQTLSGIYPGEKLAPESAVKVSTLSTLGWRIQFTLLNGTQADFTSMQPALFGSISHRDS